MSVYKEITSIMDYLLNAPPLIALLMLIKSIIQKIFPNMPKIQNYSGPEFSILDERLQQEFIEIFLNCGIDDNLGSFIEVMSVDKE